ncbi:restriction endonuclease subunit S [Algoriphagus formosus]|uniref:restriction endonuclease subunit S n=1 Tax=Algoriphagus formosus TaxID=2007308 RepID=UPI003F72C72A
MQLLEHFKELTLHPKNAEELKGLILQLAVQGKLTKTWRESRKLSGQDVEPAFVLLEKIKAEKERLVKEGKIKKENPLPVITEDEIAFGLPEGWSWCYMNDIGSTNVGLTYKPAHISEDGVPVLRSSNIQNGEIVLEDLVRVNTDYREKDIIEEGDLLICARNGSRKLVGKCAILGPQVETMVFGAFMAIFRCKYNNYVKFFIQSPLYRSRLEGVETTTINQITQGNLKSTLIPFPPLEEQKAIVSIVNQLFAEVEQLEAATKERVRLKEDYVTSALRQLTEGDTAREWAALQPHFKTFFTETQNIKTLRESILQLAVQGKLTRAWREHHPELVEGEHSAQALLERIKAEKAQLIKNKKIKKEKPLPAISEDEIPYALPEGWAWCRLGEATTYGTSEKAEAKHMKPEQWVLELEDVEKETSQLLQRVTFSNRQFKSTKSVFKKDDVIYGKLRPYLDKVIVADDDGVCTTEMIPIRSFSKCQPEYLRWFLKSPGFIEYANNSTHGMNLPRMGTEKALVALYALPPLEEQKAIVKQVNALITLCDQLEKEIETRTTALEDWMESCLREVV